MTAITKREETQSKDFSSDQPKTNSVETNINTLSYSWICDKVLTYYVISIVGLAVLKYFTIISTEGFVVGMFAGFGIGLVFMGNGLIEIAKRFNHSSNS